MSQCEAFGLLPPEAAAEVATVINVVNNWLEHFALAGVTEHDIKSLVERIDGEELLLVQRTNFDETSVRSATAKRKRTSPFQRT